MMTPEKAQKLAQAVSARYAASHPLTRQKAASVDVVKEGMAIVRKHQDMMVKDITRLREKVKRHMEKLGFNVMEITLEPMGRGNHIEGSVTFTLGSDLYGLDRFELSDMLYKEIGVSELGSNPRGEGYLLYLNSL